MNAPSWLQDEPEILALLNFVIDRFDEQPGAARSRSILPGAEQHLPSLGRGDEQADQTWALVQELARIDVLQVRPGKRGAYDAEWHNSKLAFAPTIEPVLREWLQRPAGQSRLQVWRQAVDEHASLFPAGCELLRTKHIAVPGRTSREVVMALASLGSIQRPATLRQLSTRAFWGDSKVLDERGELITALFPALQVRERPMVVVVHLPERIGGALFIENQDNYSAALDGEPSSARNHAIIYLAGFRGTALRIRSRQGVRLHFAGPGMAQREAFEHWWFDAAGMPGPLFFWGDLDFAGMQMLKSLRERFGEVQAWRPGYEPMLAELAAAAAGNRAPVDGLGARRQVDPVATGCAFADTELLPSIRKLGFWDQERMVD